MRMRVKKIFDLFVPAGDEALSGSALEDFTDQIATHFADEVRTLRVYCVAADRDTGRR